MTLIRQGIVIFRLISVFVICFFILPPFSIHARAETYKAASFLIPGGYIINRDKGFIMELFWEVVRKLEKTGDKCEFSILPVKRSSSLFKQSKIDIHFLSVKRPRKDRIHSHAVILKFDVALTRKNDPLITSIKELEGKKVGLIRGYYYPKELIENKKISISYADKYEQNMGMLIRKRIDAFIIPENICKKLIKNEKHKNQTHYCDTGPLFTHEVTFVFHKTMKGRKIQQKFNKALEELRDGSYQKILNKYKINKKLWPKMFK